MKKGFSIIMAFVTVMTMLFSGATFADDTNENTENKTKESNFTNLIVFARFLDEDEFIDIIRKIDDYFMPYIDEFREKNVTSPNHPIRKKRDEEYDQKIRVMLIANLQNNGIDVDTNLSTEELRKMFDDVMNKKHDSIDESNNSLNEESEVQKLTEKSVNDDIIYKDRYSYYYKQNNDNNNFTYYDTDNNVVEENVPEDDVLRLMTGGNLTKETIKPI